MARGDFPSSKQDQFVLRFPDGLRDRVKEAADRNSRSMNAEIIAALEYSLVADEEFRKLREQLARQEGANASLRNTLNIFVKHMIRDGTEELAKAIAMDLNPDPPDWDNDDS